MASDATVSLDVPSCGMVSVYSKPTGLTPTVMTWTNVQPGDHLISLDRIDANVTHDVTVVLPAETGATGYAFYAACSPTRVTFASTTDPGPDAITAHCAPSATSITVIATPKGTTTPAPMSFATVPFAASGTTTVTLAAYQQRPATTITAHGVTGYANAFLGAIASTTEVMVLENGGIVKITGSDASFVTGTIPGAGAVDIELVSESSAKSARLVRTLASFPSTVDVDASEMLPVPTGTIDAATTRPAITWAAASSTAATATFEVDIGALGSRVEWDVVAPPVPGSFQLPEMPADLVAPGAPFLRAVGLLDMTGFTAYHAGDITAMFEQIPAVGGQSRFSSSDNGSPPTKPSFERWRRR